MTDEGLVTAYRELYPEAPATEQSIRSRRSELSRKGLLAAAGYGKTRWGNRAQVAGPMTGISPADAGLEVRLGRVARENAATRARRLLIEGRVMIRHLDRHRVDAQVRGDSGAVREVAWDLPYRRRLGMTLIRSAERCESVGAYFSAELMRRAALELEVVDAQARAFVEELAGRWAGG